MLVYFFSAIQVTQNKRVPTFPLDCSHGQKWPLEEEAAASSWWLQKPLWKRCHSELAIYRWMNKPPQEKEPCPKAFRWGGKHTQWPEEHRRKPLGRHGKCAWWQKKTERGINWPPCMSVAHWESLVSPFCYLLYIQTLRISCSRAPKR